MERERRSGRRPRSAGHQYRPWASGSQGRRDKTARLPRRAIVTANVVLTDTGTQLLTMDVVDDEPFDFKPGQFVAIDFVHPDLGYRRSPYCLYGGSTADRSFTLLVRVVPQGPVSLFLGGLEPGDVVSFRGPSGHSMIPRETDSHLILIATGVGLGPCRCLLRHLAAADADRRVTLFWGLRLAADICLEDELTYLESALPNFDWRVSLSQPSPAWQGLTGRVTASVPGRLATLADKHFYLTSNGEMVAQLSAALRHVGVSSDRIYEESFFDHRHKPEPAAVKSIADRFVADDLQSPLTNLQAALDRKRL